MSGPVRIAFSFASHALEAHKDLVLMTQHSPFPNLQAFRGLVGSVSG
ncbi:MAG: hypothetical protein PV344_08930 [Anaplasma sp.]|nr:hypothetical protein [Anaplasma sp.]